jgi:hypothetical protein
MFAPSSTSEQQPTKSNTDLLSIAGRLVTFHGLEAWYGQPKFGNKSATEHLDIHPGSDLDRNLHGIRITCLESEGASMRRFVVLFLSIASSAILCKAAESQSALSGHWEGAAQIPGYELRLVIDLAQRDQAWVGSLTAPQFDLKGAPLSQIAIKDNDVVFEMKGVATFKARLEADGTLKGEYKQGGNSAPLLLRRVGEAQVEIPELSTPVSKAIQGEWKGDLQVPGSTISVILKLPDGGTPTVPRGELVITTQGNATYPITLWKQAGSYLFASFGESGISYDAQFHEKAAEITGTIRNGFAEVGLTLHRSTTSTFAPAAPVAHSESK